MLTQIESLLNSRALEPLSEDPEDVNALTPRHFLIGKAINFLPEPSLLKMNEYRLSRWQLIQRITQQFWQQWSTSYLQRLQSISQWHHPSHEIKVGCMVLLTDERSPPSIWRFARVTQLHPGTDNLTRVQLSYTQDGYYSTYSPNHDTRHISSAHRKLNQPGG